MRSHRESISLIKGETGTGTPVARQIRAHAFKGGGNSCLFPADGGRLTTFHLRYRAAYSRRSPPPPFVSSRPLLPILSSVSLLCSFPSIRRLSRLSPPLARSSADHSSLSPSVRAESRFLRVTQPGVGRPLIIFPRAAVPEFLNGG